MLAAVLAAFTFAACGGGGGGSYPNPPPPVANDWFFVGGFAASVSGYSNASGSLAPIPGSSATFSSSAFLTDFGVKPDGSVLAVIISGAQVGPNFQIANIASGGAISPQPLTSALTGPRGIAISSQGTLAITTDDGTVYLWMLQNNLLFAGGSAATGPLPQDVTFSADGKTLYVGNTGDGSVSVYSVSAAGALQLVQTARLWIPSSMNGIVLTRLRLSPSGNKFAAASADGVLYVADVSAVDPTLTNIQRIPVANLANLQEVIFDPAEKDIYTADQDNGGIYGYSITGGTVTPLPGSPFSTGTPFGGVAGMATNSAGDRLYAVMSARGAIDTFSRDTNSGQISPTGESVSTSAGLFVPGRIVRVPAH